MTEAVQYYGTFCTFKTKAGFYSLYEAAHGVRDPRSTPRKYVIATNNTPMLTTRNMRAIWLLAAWIHFCYPMAKNPNYWVFTNYRPSKEDMQASLPLVDVWEL